MANGNSLNTFAGVGAGGSDGHGLAWFAPADTTGPVAVAYTAETQTMTIAGAPTGGTFTLSWQGIPVANQANNVPTATLQTAINTAWAAFLNGGSIAVSGTAGTSYVFLFPTILGNVPMIAVTAAFTGGTTPTATFVETTPGAGASLATALIPTTFRSAGLCSPDGLTIAPNENSATFTPYGSTAPARTLITSSSDDFQVTFWELNQMTLSVFNRVPFGTLVAGVDGSMAIPHGAATNTLYAGVFDLVDGINKFRVYAPRLQVAKRGNFNPKQGALGEINVTFTPILDASGNAYYTYIQMGALAGTGAGS